MRTIGFVISHKNNERRRAILPQDLAPLRQANNCFIEKGYGAPLHIPDEAYRQTGCQVVARTEALKQDVIVDVKLGDGEYIKALAPEKILFGWAHAVQKVDFTSHCIQNKHTLIAWEEMEEHHRNILYRNRELAGEAAVLHALPYMGKAPYQLKAAILGRGNTAKGALRILHGLGARVDVYGSKQETLFMEKIGQYDMLVICIMWNTARTNPLMTAADLPRLKQGGMIVDVSADGSLAIEFGRTTTLADPVFALGNILYYAADNTPSLFFNTATHIISQTIAPYINMLAEEKEPPLMTKAKVIDKGRVIDPKITIYRRNLGLVE